MKNPYKDIMYSTGTPKENATFFLDADGHVVFNEKCKNCTKTCKQSHRIKIVSCKNYKEK